MGGPETNVKGLLDTLVASSRNLLKDPAWESSVDERQVRRFRSADSCESLG